MLLGILSDTHDQVERAAVAVALLAAEGAQALVHCGDLTGAAAVRACGASLPCTFVFGNNDDDREGLRRAILAVGGDCLERGGELELAGRRIAVAHGDDPRAMRRLAVATPDYFLFGHSHVPTDHRDGPTRWINPGALHRAAEWTVALLDLESDELRFFTVA